MKLTDYLAIYGAILSTAVTAWNIFRARAKIRVILIFSVDKSCDDVRHGIEISIQNPSANTVHVTSVSFLYKYKRETVWHHIKHILKFGQLSTIGWCHTDLSNFDIFDGCPISIEPGKSHNIFVPDSALEKLLQEAVSREIKAVVQDALWRNKYSNKFEYIGA